MTDDDNLNIRTLVDSANQFVARLKDAQKDWDAIQPSTRTRIFNFIVYYKALNDGLSPTISEIMIAEGIKSSSNVAYHLKALEKEGRIVVMDGKAGGIKVVGGLWSYEKPEDQNEVHIGDRENPTEEAEKTRQVDEASGASTG